MAQKSLLFTCILICLVGAPCLWADAETPAEEVIPAAELEETWTADGDVEEAGIPTPDTHGTERAEVGIQLFENLLEPPVKTMLGCPTTTCHTNWNCATFCYTTYGSMDGYCDSYGCCVCL